MASYSTTLFGAEEGGGITKELSRRTREVEGDWEKRRNLMFLATKL